MARDRLCLWMLMTGACLLLAGCAGMKQPPQNRHYYVLEYDSPLRENGPALPLILKIERFDASPIYDSTRMIFKKQAFTRDEYVYHQWRVAPGAMISDHLQRDFKTTAALAAVIRFDMMSATDALCILKGTVEEFYMSAASGKASAILAVSTTLTRRKPGALTEAILAQQRYRIAEPLEDHSPAGFAAAMSHAARRFSRALMSDVLQVMEEQF